MEEGDKNLDTKLGKDKKSYAGIPEADFVVIIKQNEKVNKQEKLIPGS